MIRLNDKNRKAMFAKGKPIKVNKLKSNIMWNEMGAWWDSLPTKTQRDIIDKRSPRLGYNDNFEALRLVDEQGGDSSFNGLSGGFDADIVAPEYNKRRGLPDNFGHGVSY
jgi:hypothetical protein